MKINIGNSVVVNDGVDDPDFGSDISGWQGRIKEIDEDGLILIRWDSFTMKQMGMELVNDCVEEGFDWEVMALSINDVQKTKERDHENDVEEMSDLIISKIK